MRSIVVVVLFVCAANAMRINYMSSPNQMYKDEIPVTNSPLNQRNAMCFGLARRTRTQTVGVPFLYNTRTGQNAPMPGNLRHMDPAIISKMDRDGWEVRTRPMSFSRPFYFRVRVCCPWDLACRRRAMPVDSRVQTQVQSQGPCENGGQLVIRGNMRQCVCPAGFRGQACQYPDLISRVQGRQNFRGRLRPTSTPRVFTDMIRQVELWKQKMYAAQGPLSPSATPPRLTQKQHMILNSLAGPWNPRAAAWNQQAIRNKMVEICRRRRLLAMRNQRLQAEMMRAIQLRGGNPYSARQQNEATQDSQVTGNPYSTRVQQQRPTQRGPAYTTVSRQPMMTSPQGSENPYSRVRPYVEPPQFGRPVDRAILSPEARTPWDMDPFNKNPNMMSDPRSMVHPLQYLKSVLRPEARTPWDMDPFQKNPALMLDPRAQAALEKERQLVALAYYRYMRTHQGGDDVTTRPSLRGVEYPGPAPSPPVNGVDLSAQLPPLTQATPTSAMEYTDNQNQIEPELDLSIGDDVTGPLGTESPQPTQLLTNVDPTSPEELPLGVERPLGPADNQEMPGAQQGPMPTPEEMGKMESCRGNLEPEMDKCLADFRLNFAQFMNPDYMALAKDVCINSAVVGPCITSKDTVCGEGNQVLLTRKMIQSVMQMMGMVCQQIMARGDTPMPPAPEPATPTNEIPPFKQSSGPLLGSSNQMVESTDHMVGSTNHPVTASEPKDSTNQPDATAEPTNKMPEVEPSTEDTEIPSLPPTEKPNHKKFDATKSDLKTKPTASPTTHSAGFTLARHETAPHDTSHDAAHPVVQQELLLLGYPAWLVIALGGLLLLVFLLSAFVCCLCLRRRKKKTVELEVMPQAMDEKKLAIIGVPPPLYFTTAVNQTQEMDVDGLSLPPLELGEEPDSDDAGTEEKTNLEEDADDESDEKTEVEEKKEKKKPKKEQQ